MEMYSFYLCFQDKKMIIFFSNSKETFTLKEENLEDLLECSGLKLL